MLTIFLKNRQEDQARFIEGTKAQDAKHSETDYNLFGLTPKCIAATPPVNGLIWIWSKPASLNI